MSHDINKDIIPVIDLFAGPGGLNEGFSHEIDEKLRFKSVLSVEKEAPEHKTLSLRAFYRFFLYKNKEVPQEYYDYIQNKNISRDELWNKFPEAAQEADEEALQYTLGDDHGDKGFSYLAEKITKALNGEKNWLLIGGPPCQAYSLVGRSKQLGEFKKTENSSKDAEKKFYSDPRHKLYRQYLRIIALFSPAVFVMENVKGILSAKLDGSLIFDRILNDLREPNVSAKEYGWDSNNNYTYHIVSFVTGTEPKFHNDFLIKSEDYGIPQARHRVILLGIRCDIWDVIDHQVEKLVTQKHTTVADVIKNLPKTRSHFSKRDDTPEKWNQYLVNFLKKSRASQLEKNVIKEINRFAVEREHFIKDQSSTNEYNHKDKELFDGWYDDTRLNTFLNHESRAHMASDLYRYLFVATKGYMDHVSPKLADFPCFLLPKHKNVIRGRKRSSEQNEQKFSDRFKVQLWDKPSSTITSHISKDGHYFIHPDPVQCRSLTVREAARLQTFPDNYFFEGNRTQQYHQVGNAVPPYLAYQLSKIVFGIFDKVMQKEIKSNHG